MQKEIHVNLRDLGALLPHRSHMLGDILPQNSLLSQQATLFAGHSTQFDNCRIQRGIRVNGAISFADQGNHHRIFNHCLISPGEPSRPHKNHSIILSLIVQFFLILFFKEVGKYPPTNITTYKKRIKNDCTQ